LRSSLPIHSLMRVIGTPLNVSPVPPLGNSTGIWLVRPDGDGSAGIMHLTK
jgi:hypothetical protein